MNNPTKQDAAKTRSMMILTILCQYCNKPLTQDLVERIHFEIIQEMEHGSTSWAFQKQAK